jgi:hypothetical protein
MKKATQQKVTDNSLNEGRVIPLYGKDEMNLVEFPFGPVTQSTAKTMEVEHEVFDKFLKREVTRRLIITGADAFGLPRPIDDQVLIGMKALTYEAGQVSRKIEFSRYQLCRVIGWEPDGRAYQRLEESFDRIAGTTLKFKDAWWDKGENEWKSKTFHLIEEVDLCSRDRLDRTRLTTGRTEQRLCSFVWSEVIWKSFQDGFIRTLDMNMFRRIAKGRRKEVSLRLFRILDKRFWYGKTAELELERLCVGTLGLSPSYCPFEMVRVLERAVEWLVECGFLSGMRIEGKRLTRESKVIFTKCTTKNRPGRQQPTVSPAINLPTVSCDHRAWLKGLSEAELHQSETLALDAVFGSELERKIILEERALGNTIKEAGPIRTEYVRKYRHHRGEKELLSERQGEGDSRLVDVEHFPRKAAP